MAQPDETSTPQPASDTADDQRPEPSGETSTDTDADPRAETKADTVREPVRERVVEKRRSGFFMRWLKRLAALVVFLIVLLLLLGLGATLILRSDLPRSIAESVATGALRLDTRLGRLDVGWDGDILIEDLVLRLPSEDGEGAKLVEVPRLTAELGALPLVAFRAITGQQPDVKAVEVESPVAYLTQDEEGQWNWQRAAGLINLGKGPQDPEQTGPPNIPPLPNLSLTDGRLIVRNQAGEEATVENIRATGERASPLLYNLRGGVADAVTFEGQLIPNTGLRQQVQLEVSNLPPLLQPVFSLPDSQLKASWNGGFGKDGQISGVVTIDRASVAGITAEGKVEVQQTEAGGATLTPVDLMAAGVPGTQEPVEVLAGEVVVGAGEVRVDELLLRGMDGRLLVRHAIFDTEELGGNFQIAFQNLQPADQANLNGSLSGSLTYGPFGTPEAQLQLDAWGTIGDRGMQELSLEVVAQGHNYRDFRTLDITATLLEAPILLGTTEESTILPRLTAEVLVRMDDPQLPRIELAELRSLESEAVALRGQGAYYFDDQRPNPEWQQGQYWLWLEEAGWPVQLPRMAEAMPLDLGFVIQGRIDRAAGIIAPVRISSLYGSLADIDIAGEGWYVIAPAAERVHPESTAAAVPPSLRPSDLAEDLASRALSTTRPVLPPAPDAADSPPAKLVASGANPPMWLLLTLTRDSRMPAPTTPGASQLLAIQQAMNPVPQVEQAARPDPGSVAEEAREAAPDPADVATPLSGTIAVWLNILGDPATFLFEAEGSVETTRLVVGDYEIGNIRSDLSASLNRQRLTVRTPERPIEMEHLIDAPPWAWRPVGDVEPAQLLGANVTLIADVPFDEREPGVVQLDVQDLDLRRVSAAAALPPVLGELDAELLLRLQGLSVNNMRLDRQSVITIDQLALPEIVLAEQVTIRPTLDNGVLRVPIRLRQDYESLAGPVSLAEERTLGLELEYDLARPQELSILNIQSADYPVTFPRGTVGTDVWGDVLLTLDSPAIAINLSGEHPAVRGDLAAQAEVVVGRTPFVRELFADASFVADATQTQIGIEELVVDLPGIGRINGGGDIELQDVPGQSRVYVHGQELDLQAMAARLRLPEGAEGLINFSLSVQPGPGQRPRGDVLVDLAFQGTDARWRDLKIDQGQALVYLSRAPHVDGSPPRGQYDFTVITTQRARLQIGDGIIDAYFKVRNRGTREPTPDPSEAAEALAAVTREEAQDEWYLNATLDIADLDLSQIAGLAGQEDAEGQLDLSATAFGALNAQRRVPEQEQDNILPINGQAEISIRDGELATFNLVQQILQFVRIIPGSPSDTVDANVRLELGNVQVESVVAFIDGTEIRGTGTIDDVFNPERFYADLSVVVFLRPFSQIPLPFFREADDVLAALQSNATAVSVTGQPGDWHVVQRQFQEIGQTLRALLVGGARNSP